MPHDIDCSRERRSGGEILEGVKLGERDIGAIPLGQVTYCVIEAPPPTPAAADPRPDDRRKEPRQRTRLRSGKIVDLRNKFITECVIHDRSAKGAWLRLVRDVPVPNHIRLYDDEAKTIISANVVRRRGVEVGVRLMLETERKAEDPTAAALGEKYYAMKE